MGERARLATIVGVFYAKAVLSFAGMKEPKKADGMTCSEAGHARVGEVIGDG